MNAPILVLAVLTLAFAGAALFVFAKLGRLRTELARGDQTVRRHCARVPEPARQGTIRGDKAVAPRVHRNQDQVPRFTKAV